MSNADKVNVPSELVDAALRAANALGKDVADVPILAIAERAGISRSTLLRRLGGRRHALDEAVRAAGVDPGGRRPVRERAIEAGAHLIGEQGLAAATLEAVAAAAQCSVHSLYAAFGGRNELLSAIFERYSPLADIEQALSGPSATVEETVRRIHRRMAEGFLRRPQVMPAIIAESLARSGDSSFEAVTRHMGPRIFATLGGWLASEVAAGRIRDLPLPLLIHQLVGPVVVHFVIRPVGERMMPFPGVEETCEVFTQAFLRAVGLPEPCHTPNQRRPA